MANFAFIAHIDNNWNSVLRDTHTNAIVETNWNPFPGFPGSGDDVTINAGSDVVVQGGLPDTNQPDVVLDLLVSGGATLEVDSSLTVAKTLDNAGGLTVKGTLISGTAAGATITNDGQLTLQSSSGMLQIGTFDVLLNGAGTLFLDSGSRITGTSPGVPPTLHNESTISGVGTIGNNGVNNLMAIDNRVGGVIDGTSQNVADTLTIDSTLQGGPTGSTPVDNAGTLEGTGAGGLTLLGTTVRQVASGVIKADGLDANVELDGVTVTGGTVEGVNGGTVQIKAGPNSNFTNSTFDGSTAAGAVNTAGNILLHSSASLTVKGTLHNIGTITMLMDFHPALLLIDSGSVTLNGGGHIVMTVPPNADEREAITGNNTNTPSTLHNVDNRISGSGDITDSAGRQLILDNQAAGVIDADSNTGEPFHNITIALSHAVQNAGTIEATGTSGLSIQGTEVDQTAIGVIGASGAGAHVDFNGATIVGGTLTTTNGGVLQTEQINSALSGAILDGSTAAGVVKLTSSANVLVHHGAPLTMKGAIQNGGLITASALIAIQSDVSLTGGGTIATSNQLAGSTSAAVTLHNVNNTISGTGTIEGQAFALTIDNQAGGTIAASSATAGDQLVIDSTSAGAPGAFTPITNAGTLKATGAAALVLEGGTIHQSGAGNILADGANAHVTLEGATIVGGLIATANGGVIDFHVPNGNFETTTFDGSAGALTIAGTVNVSSTLALNGSIVNQGTINDGGIIEVLGSGVTLSGGGHLVIPVVGYNSGGIKGFSTTTSTTLHNVDNTISGAGTIGFGQPFLGNSNLLVFDNQASGTVNADNADGTLTIRTGFSSVTTGNAGLLEASSAPGLVIDTTRIHNTGGTIQGNAGSLVDIINSQIDGGTFKTVGSGVIRFDGTGNTLTGADNIGGAIINLGTLDISNGADLFAAGTLHNAGTILVDGKFTPGLNVDGGGHVTLTNANAVVNGVLNNIDNTVAGVGTITAGGENTGVITANVAGQSLILNPSANIGSGQIGPGQTITNLGILEADGGILDVRDAVAGSGHAMITAGGTAEFALAFDQDVTFAGLGTLKLAQAYAGTISGLAVGDHVVLSALAPAAGDHLAFGAHTVSILDGSNHALASFAVAGTYGAHQFVLGDDGHGHLDVTVGAGSGIPDISDMNGDGVNDLVFQSQSNGETLYATMPDGTIAGDVFPILHLSSTVFRAAGTGDVDGDGVADVVFQAGNSIFFKAAGDIAHGLGAVAFTVPAGWQVTGVGDVNGDGAADILFSDTNAQDATAGETFYFDVKATLATAAGGTPQVVGSNVANLGSDFVLRGIADINGDGVGDAVFQSVSTGVTIYSDMAAVAAHVAANNFTLTDTQHVVVASGIDASYVAKAAGDLDGDGFADVVFEREVDPGNGQPISSTLLEAHNDGSGHFTLAAIAPNLAAFDVKAIADVTGDGIGDILMQYTQHLNFNGAELQGTVAYYDPAHGATPASLGLVQQTLGFGADYVLV